MKLKPCKLVNLSVRERGGVTYKREDLGTRLDGVREESAWRTDREIADVEEHKRAVEVRAKARALCSGVCVQTPFTLVCLTEQLPLLEARKVEAEALVAEFNATAKHGQIHFHLLTAEIAENSREAVESLRGDIAVMLADLKGAVAAQDVKQIRSVASRVTGAVDLLGDAESGGALKKAVEAARRTASAVAKALKEGADSLEADLVDLNLRPISEAEFMFLGGAAAGSTASHAPDPQATIFEALEGVDLPAELPAVETPSAPVEINPEDWTPDFSGIPEDTNNPYEEGRSAGFSGMFESANPHAADTEAFTEWSRGWADGAVAGDPALAAYMEGA